MAGSIPLFMVGVVIYLFFASAIGIFLGTVAHSMPQLGLLFMLVYLPMNMLSGGNTPLDSMPLWLARFMQVSPSTHFVAFAQSILYRGAGLRGGVAAISRCCRDQRPVLRPRHPALPLRCRPGSLGCGARELPGSPLLPCLAIAAGFKIREDLFGGLTAGCNAAISRSAVASLSCGCRRRLSSVRLNFKTGTPFRQFERDPHEGTSR